MNPPRRDPNQNRRALISLSAYQKYLSRGGEPGHDTQDWLEAEHEILNTQEQPDFQATKISALTKQELEIIELVAEGAKNKQIAVYLETNEQTVRQHLLAIFSKLEVADRFELIVYAYRQNLKKFNS